MFISTKNNLLILKNGRLTETCACCGECGCASSPFPSSFKVTFSGFSFSLFQSIEGTPISNAPSLLKSFLEGLSPLFVPRETGTNNYVRTRCLEYDTQENCNSYPPGFSSREVTAAGVVPTLSFGLACDGRATANVLASALPQFNPQGKVSWRIDAFLPGGVDCQIFISFPHQLVFASNDICDLQSEQSQVAVVPSVKTDQFTIVAGTFVRRIASPFIYSGYSGTGTVSFEPDFNPLP